MAVRMHIFMKSGFMEPKRTNDVKAYVTVQPSDAAAGTDIGRLNCYKILSFMGKIVEIIYPLWYYLNIKSKTR